jgi:ABC-2 type transport system permease protein
MSLLIYSIVMGKFLGAERGIPDFAIYVFTGLTAYGLFNEIVSGGTGSILGNAGLIKKIYLPREVFPLASVGSALFNFMIQLVILILATIVFRHPPLSANLWYFIPSFFTIVIYGTVLALFLSAANVYLRDIQYLVEVLLMILLWASPVVYSWSIVRDTVRHALIVNLYTDNPMTLAVLGFQKAFWLAGAGTAEYPAHLALRMAIAIVIGLVLLFVAQRLFSRMQGNFAQEL